MNTYQYGLITTPEKMNTKEKYTEIIKEVVRNEAVSKDKLVKLAEKYDANKLKIQFFLRKAGVIEGLGNGVNRVLVRDQEIAPYVDKVLELTKGGYKKKTDKGLPGKWDNTKEQPDEEPYHKYINVHARWEGEEDDDPNTHARAKTTDLQHANYESIKMQEERVAGIEKRIAELENRMNMCGEDIQGFDDKIDGQVELLEDKLEERIKKIEAGHTSIERLQLYLDKASERISNLEDRLVLNEFFEDYNSSAHKEYDRRLAELDNRLNNIEADHTKTDRNLNINIKIT